MRSQRKSDSEYIKADIDRTFLGGCLGAAASLIAGATWGWIVAHRGTQGGNLLGVIGVLVGAVVAAPLGFLVGGFLFWLVPEFVGGLGLLILIPVSWLLRDFMPNRARIGSFVASPNPVTAGDSLTLTATEITEPKWSFAVTGVDFYFRHCPIMVQVWHKDGMRISGTDWHESLLGYGTRTSSGVWSLELTASLEPGTHTLLTRTRNRLAHLGSPTETQLIVH